MPVQKGFCNKAAAALNKDVGAICTDVVGSVGHKSNPDVQANVKMRFTS
jgi:hypothetical protein